MTIKAINVRNQFKGVIKEILLGEVVSEIDVQTASGIVTSVITTRSVRDLELKVGSEVIAFVKSTEVSIAKLSTPNRVRERRGAVPSVNSIENFPDLILGHDTFARSLDQLERAISIQRDAQGAGQRDADAGPCLKQCPERLFALQRLPDGGGHALQRI